MKKILTLLICLLLLVSCSRKAPVPSSLAPTTTVPPNYTIQDFYPFEENIKTKFVGSSTEYSSKETFVDFIKNNRMQLRIVSSGTTLGQVLENKNGELRLLKSTEEFYYKEDLTSIENDKSEILLKEPLVKGTTWTLADGRKRFISNGEVEIKVPAGTFKALEITTEGKDSQTLDYYVKNMGLVKSIFKANGSEIVMNLDKREANAKYTTPVKLYYSDFINGKIVFTNKAVAMGTNEEFKTVIEKYLKEPLNKDIPAIIGEKTKVNKVYFDTKEKKAYLDLSKEFLKELNAGSSYELSVIKSITNTIGSYYGVNKVFITLEGSPYASGHIALKQNEGFSVDYKGVEEYKASEKK